MSCDRMGVNVSEWFLANVRLRQGCVMPLSLFKVNIDGLVQEVNVAIIWIVWRKTTRNRKGADK